MTVKQTPAEVEALAEAMWQILDDMGEAGQTCCLHAKAKARLAVEPWLDGDPLIDWMTLGDARAIVEECERS